MTALRVGFLGDSYRKRSFTRRYQHFFRNPKLAGGLELLRGSKPKLESLPVSVAVHEHLVRAGCMFFGTTTRRLSRGYTGKKPTGKKAAIYVGNLKIGAKDNEVTEYIKRRCEKLCIRPPTIHNCKIFERDAEEGEIVEFCGARLTIDQGPLETICDRQFWPGRSYGRPWVFRDRETSKENTNAK